VLFLLVDNNVERRSMRELEMKSEEGKDSLDLVKGFENDES
jgi:hypothetical protein